MSHWIPGYWYEIGEGNGETPTPVVLELPPPGASVKSPKGPVTSRAITEETLRDFGVAAVYTKQRWEDDWSPQPYLYADTVYFGCGPEMGRATLSWRYGHGMQPDAMAFAEYTRKSILDQYVKIVLSPGGEASDIKWYGVIVEVSDDRHGALPIGVWNRLHTGVQTFVAYSMDFLLQRTHVNTSWAKATSPYGGQRELLLRRALTFNQRNPVSANQPYGNRSQTPGSNGVFLFTDDLANADTWSSWSIIHYLFEYHLPRDPNGTAWLPWKVTIRGDDSLFMWDKPVVRAHGRDVRSIIEELCNLRRNLSWTVTVDENVGEHGTTFLDVFTFNSQTMTLPTGQVQVSNPDLVSLDFDQSVDMEATLKDSAFHKVDQVIVRGAKKRSVFSISFADTTLTTDWAQADEQAYEAGPAGISELDSFEQDQRINNLRAEPRFERVYSWFRMPTAWDGTVRNGTGGALYSFFPDDDEYGTETIYVPDMRFLPHLPWTLVAYAPWIQGSTPTGDPYGQPTPLALLKIETGAGANPDRYQRVDQINQGEGFDPDDDNDREFLKWSASLQIQRDAPGIILRVSGGPQHVIAKTDFAASLEADYPAELDYKDNLIATVAIECDSHVEQRYPLNADLEARQIDVTKRFFLDLGNRARLDYIVPGTVVGVANGILQRAETPYFPGNGILWDDRRMMLDLARFIYEWYGVTRQAFDLTIKRFYGDLSIGYLITTIGGPQELEEEVNSVVTGIMYNLVDGQTIVSTSFAEIDVLQL